MVVQLKDVAKRAGVGVGTASRVINNHPSVTEDKRKRVLDAIEELGYKRNAIAGSLKTNKTKTIGVIIPDISNEYYSDIVRGAEDIASEFQYTIILCNTDSKLKREISTINMLCEKQVDGLIMITYHMTEKTLNCLLATGIPVMMVATLVENHDISTVNISNEAAAYDATNYLIKLGHKRIAMITGPLDDIDGGLNRLNGYKRALSENNLPIDESIICTGDYRYNSGYSNMKELLKRNFNISAVFTASDYMAIGASKAIQEKGLRVPNDIAIIGFDNLTITEYAYPSISTVAQPCYEMGQVAVRRLTSLINDETIDNSHLILPHRIIERASTGNLVKI